jgi:hypothetical protein
MAKIMALAGNRDKFYSKKPGALCSEKTLEEIREDIRKYGDDKLQRFDEMTHLFQ